MEPIRAWSRGNVLYERHRYAPGPAAELPRHAHAEYQLCAAFGFPGEYHYRGARHPVPTGTLTVLHPGEAHVVRDPYDRDAAATYLMMYVAPGRFAEVASQVAGRVEPEPFFGDAVLRDPDLVRLFVALSIASRRAQPGLRVDELLVELLTRMVERHAGVRRNDRRPRRAHAVVARVRAHLEERYHEPMRLRDLASMVHLSPHRLNRIFSEQVGVPPHRYQLNVRIDRVKRRLALGEDIATAAVAAGFADQAHLSRHFRRLVGLPPGRYRRAARQEPSRRA
jgi:AraC-like DNA-binding protein